MTKLIKTGWIGLLSLNLLTSVALADGLYSGTRTIELVDNKGVRYPIGQVVFSPFRAIEWS